MGSSYVAPEPSLGRLPWGRLNFSLGSQALLARSPGTSKGVTCPGHNQTLLWLSLCHSLEPALCSFGRVLMVLVGYFSKILRKVTVFPQKHVISAFSLGVHISPSTSVLGANVLQGNLSCLVASVLPHPVQSISHVRHSYEHQHQQQPYYYLSCLTLFSSLFQGPEGEVCLRLRTTAEAAGANWILGICTWNM